MPIPTNEEILALLDDLAHCTADDLESQWLEFKPWYNVKEDMKVAVEYAVCFANADGGAIVFSVWPIRRKDGPLRFEAPWVMSWMSGGVRYMLPQFLI